MRRLTPLLDGMTHTEGARWHDGRFWFSDLYSERVCSMREDGTDLRTEMAVPQCPSGIGSKTARWWWPNRSAIACRHSTSGPMVRSRRAAPIR